MAISSKDDGKPTQDGSEENSESEEEQVRRRVPKMVNSSDDDDGTDDWKHTQNGSEDFSEEEEKHRQLQRKMASCSEDNWTGDGKPRQDECKDNSEEEDVLQEETESVEKRSECVLRALRLYLNEDPSILFKEYLDSDATGVQSELEQVTVFTVSDEGGDASTPPADVGMVMEGAEVLPDLGDMASARALLMGVIYALNLSYPQELKASFEVLQKFFLQLDASRLSTKVQMLKNKLYE